MVSILPSHRILDPLNDILSSGFTIRSHCVLHSDDETQNRAACRPSPLRLYCSCFHHKSLSSLQAIRYVSFNYCSS
jgi:hypothetical protein